MRFAWHELKLARLVFRRKEVKLVREESKGVVSHSQC